MDMGDLYFFHLVQLACSELTCSPRFQNRIATLDGMWLEELDIILAVGIVNERLVISQKLSYLN